MDGLEGKEPHGKPVVLAFFVINYYYYFLCGRRAWETLFIWEIELVC
jgi:hypothetical protein